MITESKLCRSCKEALPLSDFSPHNRNKTTGHVTYRLDCKSCHSAKKREGYCPDKNASAMLKRNYGITLADYDRMVEKQNGKCAICETTEPSGNGARFAVDHDHKTGEVRGLLCFDCNSGIGKFKDDAALLTSAIEYLKDYSNV